MRLCRFVLCVQNDPCYFFLLLFSCNSLFCCPLQQSGTRSVFFFFLFSTNSGMQLNETAARGRFVSVGALSSLSARLAVCGLAGSWMRSWVPRPPPPRLLRLQLGVAGSSKDKSAGIHPRRGRNPHKLGCCKEMKNRCCPQRRPGFSICSLLASCIIIVTPVPSRDTRSLSSVRPGLSAATVRENDSSVLLLSCQFAKNWDKSDGHVSRGIYVPFSLEQQCDQHYVILQANRYLIKRRDVDGYFKEGCAD